MSKVLSLNLTLLMLFYVAAFAKAEDEKNPPPVDLQKLMEAMEKAGTPGSHHKKLEPLNGNWDYSVKFWMDPNQPAMTMKGTCVRKWILGGRYLHEAIENAGESMPFKGIGLTGYDNLRKRYSAIWVDSMSTSIFTSYGDLDKGGKKLTFHGKEVDPVTKKIVKTRDVIIIENQNKHRMEAYRKKPGAKKEVKVMEIVYTRKK